LTRGRKTVCLAETLGVLAGEVCFDDDVPTHFAIESECNEAAKLVNRYGKVKNVRSKYWQSRRPAGCYKFNGAVWWNAKSFNPDDARITMKWRERVCFHQGDFDHKLDDLVEYAKVRAAKVERAKVVEAAKVVLEAAKVEAAAAKVEAAKVESAKVESAKVESAKVEPAKVDPAKVEPDKVEAAKAEAAATAAAAAAATAATAAANGAGTKLNAAGTPMNPSLMP